MGLSLTEEANGSLFYVPIRVPLFCMQGPHNSLHEYAHFGPLRISADKSKVISENQMLSVSDLEGA